MGADRQEQPLTLTRPPKARPTAAFLAGLACFYLGCWVQGAAGGALVVAAAGCLLLFALDAFRLRRLARARGQEGEAPGPQPPAESPAAGQAGQGRPPGRKRRGG